MSACDCCSRIYRDKLPNAYQPGKARYIWTHQNGNRSRLCVSCCAIWRENVTEDQSDPPLRITEITTAKVKFLKARLDADAAEIAKQPDEGARLLHHAAPRRDAPRSDGPAHGGRRPVRVDVSALVAL